MANHKSALKRLKQSLVQKTRNKYYHKSTRTAIKELRNEKNKSIAIKKLSKVSSMIDKLSNRNIIHKNKSSNLKSGLSKLVNKL